MSLSEIKTVLAVDSVVYNTDPTFIIKQGAQDVLYENNPSQSYSDSNINFQVTPSSNETYMSRYMLIKCVFDVTMTGTQDPSTGVLLVDGYHAPRADPLASVTTNINLQINNNSVNANLNDYIDAVKRYGIGNELQNQIYSTAPVTPDYALYDDTELINSNMSPFNNWYSGVQMATQPRAGFYGYEVLNAGNTATPAVVRITTVEPIYVSPNLFQSQNEKGYINVNQLKINMQIGGLERVMSLSSLSPATISTISVEVSTQPELRVYYLKPTINSLETLKKDNWYPLQVTDSHSQSRQNVTAGSEFTVTTSNIQLQSVPDEIFIFARKSNATRTAFDADIYAVPKSISIVYNSRSGQLASATTEDLYEMCVRNGLKGINYSSYRNHCGAPLCINTARNLANQNDTAVGSAGQFSFYYTATFEDLHTSGSIDYEIFTVFVNEGVMLISSSGNVQTFVGIVQPNDVLRAKDMGLVAYETFANRDSTFLGGSFIDSVKSGLRSTGKFIKDKAIPAVVKYTPKVVSAVEKLLPLLLAAGMTQPEALELIHTNPKLAKKIGGAMIGGGANIGGSLVGGLSASSYGVNNFSGGARAQPKRIKKRYA